MKCSNHTRHFIGCGPFPCSSLQKKLVQTQGKRGTHHLEVRTIDELNSHDQSVSTARKTLTVESFPDKLFPTAMIRPSAEQATMPPDS